MKVGIPREIKNHEYRVAISPAGVHELVGRGHEVVIETGAGVGSSFSDEDFKAAGAQILGSADQVWTDADLLLKVKEPIAEEYSRLRKDQVLFHLPAPGGVEGMHRRAPDVEDHLHRLRNSCRFRRFTAPPRPDE